MKFLSALLACLSSVTFAQVTTMNNLGTVTAVSVSKAMGSNFGGNQQEFIAAQAMHINFARIGTCGWGTIEGQSAAPANTSTGLALTTGCRNSITWAAQNGMTAEPEAVYGPPFHQTLTVTSNATYTSGTTTLVLNFVSGVGGSTLASIAYPYDYLYNGPTLLCANAEYSGCMITSVSVSGSQATITLGSALTQTVSSGQTLTINKVLYPAVVTGVYASEPSLQQYVSYARYLYTQGQAISGPYGQQTSVGIWNEPPWPNSCWDNRTDCYDTNPGLTGNIGTNSANFGMADGLQQGSGGSFIMDHPDKTGSNSLLGSRMLSQTGHSLNQPTTGGVNNESFHFYPNNPEDFAFSYPCIYASPSSGSSCNLLPSGANFVTAVANTITAQKANGPTYGIGHVMTEGGYSTAGNLLTEIQKTRGNLRMFWSTAAMLLQNPPNATTIAFYRLYDPGDPAGTTLTSALTLTTNGTPCGTSCLGANGYTMLPWGTALAAQGIDLAQIANAPVEAVSVPAISSYSGTYKLNYVNIAGSTVGATHNSYTVVAWQMSAVTSGYWYSLASPSPGSFTINVPAGYALYATNMTTRATVIPTFAGSVATVPVTDDPVEMTFAPTSNWFI